MREPLAASRGAVRLRRPFHSTVIAETGDLPARKLKDRNAAQPRFAARLQVGWKIRLQDRMVGDLGNWPGLVLRPNSSSIMLRMQGQSADLSAKLALDRLTARSSIPDSLSNFIVIFSVVRNPG